jgi:phospholipid-binding lipoprotein MlaA
MPHHDNDFGTTLGRWGAQPGPYMFLPLVGPSDLRDSVGGVVNIFLNPFTWVKYDHRTVVTVITTVENGIDKRYEARQALDTVRDTSTDPYATLRSFYQQSREAAIHGPAAVSLPDFEPDMPSEPGSQTAPQSGPQNLPDLPPIESEPEPSVAPTEPQPQASPAAPSEPATPAPPAAQSPSTAPEPAH